VAAARARLAPGRRRERGGLNAVPGRPLTRWANAAMLAVAVAALGVLVAAFLPLVKVWAVHEWARTGSGGPYRLVLWVQAATAGGIVLAHLVAGLCVLVWTGRACANRGFPRRVAVALWPAAAAFVLGKLAAGRGGRWLAAVWWLAWVAAGAAVVGGLAVGHDAAVNNALAGGSKIEVGLADRLLAHEVAAVLPGAALYLAAAVLFLVLVHRITTGQAPTAPRSATIAP